MTFEHKANYVVEQARAIAPNVRNWADYAAAVFGQKDGVIAKAFTDEAERQLFYDSAQYKIVSELRLQLMKKFGTDKGGTPEKSGRILVRIPRVVHKALEIEAASEGVSLNQLAVSKLSIPLRDRINLSLPVIAEAYRRVFDGYSTDRVVIDPELNAKFLSACRHLGMTEADYKINHALLDARKSKKIDLPEATKRTEFRDYDQYRFASEIAVRILQRSKGVSLDQILCDPALSFEFDEIAKQLAPGQPALKLRSAALNLRKTRKLGPSKITLDATVDLIPAGPIRLLKPSDLPEHPGVYSFYDQNRPIFAGETNDLRNRVNLHRAGNMPQWLRLDDDFGYILKYGPLPKAKDRTSWLEWFVAQEQPLLNYQRSA